MVINQPACVYSKPRSPHGIITLSHSAGCRELIKPPKRMAAFGNQATDATVSSTSHSNSVRLWAPNGDFATVHTSVQSQILLARVVFSSSLAGVERYRSDSRHWTLSIYRLLVPSPALTPRLPITYPPQPPSKLYSKRKHRSRQPDASNCLFLQLDSLALPHPASALRLEG